MSISSHPEDKDEIEKKNRTEHVVIEDSKTGKKYVRIWRIEASREFILLMFIIVALLAVSLYNPYQLLQVTKEDVKNTDRIIYNQESNWDRIKQFITAQENSRISGGADLVKLLFLFHLDQERDISKIMKGHNISNTHFVDLNATHYITEKGAFLLPYNISFAKLFNHTGLTD
jgi:cell division protein FtsL